MSPGSSPLARGLLRAASSGCALCGIIPARAGFTKLTDRTVGDRPDHPRSRGVYSTTRTGWEVVAGSSPLARGLRRRVVVGVGDAGIIPARAGFTVAVVVVIGVSPDHPRSRGVYSPSSPTARTVKDHPRSRGVYAANVFARLPVDGSSPLARGLRRPGSS